MWLIGRSFTSGKRAFAGSTSAIHAYGLYPPLRQIGKVLGSIRDRGGLVAEVLEGGTIKKGDRISIKAIPGRLITIATASRQRDWLSVRI